MVSRLRILLFLLGGLLITLLLAYLNRSVIQKYGSPLIYKKDSHSTLKQSLLKLQTTNTSTVRNSTSISDKTEGNTSLNDQSINKVNSNKPPIIREQSTESLTLQNSHQNITLQQLTSEFNLNKFDRHTGFDHGKNNKLWEIIDHNNVIIRRLAYYDERDVVQPAIILVALHDDRQKKKRNLYLSVSYLKNQTANCIPLEYWLKSGKLDYVMHEFYVNYMLKTKGEVRLREKPISVAVTTDRKCQSDLTDSIPVQGTKLSPNKRGGATYGICLHKGLFNLKDTQVVIDWIELNKELGVQFITIYLQSASEDIYKVVKPYIESGFIEVLDWALRKPHIPTGYTRDYGQSGVINECIYRNMNRVKYLGLYDVDEFIIPGLQYRKIPEILPILEGKTESKLIAAYVFNNTYFYTSSRSVPQVINETKLCPGMKMPLYFSRTQRASNPKVYGSPKLIVKPLAVNSVQVHYVVSTREGFSAEYGVPNELGASHHYRSKPRMKGKTPTFYCPDVGRYASAVLPRIKKQMCNK